MLLENFKLKITIIVYNWFLGSNNICPYTVLDGHGNCQAGLCWLSINPEFDVDHGTIWFE